MSVDQKSKPSQKESLRKMPEAADQDPTKGPKKVEDLEVKDAQLIFHTVWHELEQEFGGENLRFPAEILKKRRLFQTPRGWVTTDLAPARGW